MWRYVVWYEIIDVSKEHIAFIVKGQLDDKEITPHIGKYSTCVVCSVYVCMARP